MTRLLQDETQTHDSKGGPNNCASCDHKRYPDGGHCYMFRHEPEWECNQHTARRPFTMSLFEVARMAAEITDAQIRDQDSLFGCLEEPRK